MSLETADGDNPDVFGGAGKASALDNAPEDAHFVRRIGHIQEQISRVKRIQPHYRANVIELSWPSRKGNSGRRGCDRTAEGKSYGLGPTKASPACLCRDCRGSFLRSDRSGAALSARPIRMIVPVAAGGPVDAINRIIVQKLSERWGSQFHVENIPTGAGNVATGTAAKAPADGHTVLAVTTAFVINPSLYANLSYDPVKDFAPITLVGASPHVMVVYPSLPANSAKELVALVKANPGKYSYASPGTGQSGQLAGEMFRQACGLDLAHVPFNGAVPAITSTIAGHTQIAFMSLAAAAGSIKEGKLRALAVTSRRRSDSFKMCRQWPKQVSRTRSPSFGQGLVFPARNSKGNRRSLAPRGHRHRCAARGQRPHGSDEPRAGREFAGGIR